eukprot:Gregarina_sp_Poly_1__5614@NODE_2961_length_1502_cov_26_422997_g1869_i0_p1_GENE_NODE_2961_length_1502_cov_26_422997_g1869_i0NODE_2961_length_1502_cov_26_422997_g1869_i0_p1_ORF_typecomplete_len248_score62_43GET2/PF08690_10/4_4_NODE_2961_length_1502_cov_26_422997_g1869_i0142885
MRAFTLFVIASLLAHSGDARPNKLLAESGTAADAEEEAETTQPLNEEPLPEIPEEFDEQQLLQLVQESEKLEDETSNATEKLEEEPADEALNTTEASEGESTQMPEELPELLLQQLPGAEVEAETTEASDEKPVEPAADPEVPLAPEDEEDELLQTPSDDIADFSPLYEGAEEEGETTEPAEEHEEEDSNLAEQIPIRALGKKRGGYGYPIPVSVLVTPVKGKGFYAGKGGYGGKGGYAGAFGRYGF